MNKNQIMLGVIVLAVLIIYDLWIKSMLMKTGIAGA